MSIKLPDDLKGMTELDRERFKQTLVVPFVNVSVQRLESSKWKEFLLSLCSFKNVRDCDPPSKTHKQVLFNPERIQTKENLIEKIPSIKDFVDESFGFTSVTINYENYSIEQVMKAILPDDLVTDKRVNNGSGYSLIGHIAHFNLRDEVLPFKKILAQVILDKLPNVKTVVNKLHEIDSVYRNFELEIIGGEPNTVVQCRESKAIFQFDFAKVYWNPRLSTEHERIIDLVRPNDVVFDVCAGVGPFVVPTSMLGAVVFANDINPECYKWLNINLKKNQPKKSSREFFVSNLDGREFLQTIVFHRIRQIQNENEAKTIFILMNLPALAITFFDVFAVWLNENVEEKLQWKIPVKIFCYTFSRGENHDEEIRSRLNEIISNVESERISCRFVRQVAPNKDMMCVQMNLFGEKISTKENFKRFKADRSE